MEFFKPGRVFDFMGQRVFWIPLSFILVIALDHPLASIPGPNYGTDFRGGTEVEIAFKKPIDAAGVRKARARTAGFPTPGRRAGRRREQPVPLPHPRPGRERHHRRGEGRPQAARSASRRTRRRPLDDATSARRTRARPR